HRTRQSADINSLNEPVYDPNFDACCVTQLLWQNDNADQNIAGLDVCLLQLGGELEDLGDCDSLPNQRRGEFASDRDELFELTLNIEPGEHEAQLFRVRRESRRFRRIDRRNLGRRSRLSRKPRRCNLAWCRREDLRLSQSASSCDKQRPQQYSSQQLHAVSAHRSSPALARACLRALRLGIQTDAKTRSNDKRLKRICCAAIAHRISAHHKSLRMWSRASSFARRRNSLERGKISTATHGPVRVGSNPVGAVQSSTTKQRGTTRRPALRRALRR